MGQTRVDLLHLLEDLRDAYPGSLEETIIAETVANALDSGARRVSFTAEPDGRALVIVDDGAGMTRSQLRRYHDLAATSKKRGKGIGFAGVGIKLALLECDEVVTESRRGARAYATRWRLASRQKAPWEYIDPPGLVATPAGTGLRLTFATPFSPLLDPGWIVTALLRGFAPLFDPTFDDILAASYPDGVRFRVNGQTIPRVVAAGVRILGRDATDHAISDRSGIAVRLPRKRKPSAVGWLARADVPLPDAERGVAVSTLGKVIRRGWDWLGITPAAGDRITGLIEAPGLAESLQLNKADFIRTGPRGAAYLAYRKAVQETVSAQLAAWGEDSPPDRPKRQRTRPMERDLEKVLLGMADEFPLLSALVERRAGGQKRIPMSRPDSRAASTQAWAPTDPLARSTGAADDAPSGPDQGTTRTDQSAGDRAPDRTEPGADAALPPTSPVTLPGRATGRRKGRYVLEIRFESRPDSDDLARLVESTVWVNEAHPAWIRAAASRAEGYHVALSVAMALAPLAVEPAHAHAFITAFLSRWGEAAEGTRKRKGRKRATPRPAPARLPDPA
jgi:hypothetical protein